MRDRFFKIIIYIISLFWIFTILNNFITSNTHFGFFNQSMVINYSQGFIRRGLLGEFFKKLHFLTHVNIFLLIKIFCLANYLFFIGYILVVFCKKKLSYTFLFLPYVLPYYVFLGFINAKDFFLLNLFLLQLICLKKIKNNFYKIIILNAISIIGILTHEIFFFISIPILIYHLIIENKKPLKKIDLLLYAIYFIPSLIVILLCIKYHGNPNIAYLIYQDVLSYIPKNMENVEMNDGVASLGDRAENKITHVFKDLMWNGFSRGVSYLIYFITLLYILLNLDKINIDLFKRKENFNTINPINITFIFIFQTICLIPIYYVAIDWQRWLSIALYQAILYNVFFYDSKILPYAKIMYKLKHIYSLFFNSSKSTVLLISIFCIIPYFKLGNTNYQFNNVFLIFMNYISKVISVILK